MTDINKHIESLVRKAKSSLKIIALLTIAICLFLPRSANAQVLNNEGANINVVDAVVDGGDVENNNFGTIKNDGTINLLGDYRNNANTMGNGYYNIKGDWINLDTFFPDSSMVQLYGTTLQNVINPPGDLFNNLRINNSGNYDSGAGSKILLHHDIEVKNELTMDQGVIEFTDSATNRLYLMNRAANSLIHLSGRIIGKFERGINSTENYLFPLGSSEYYNPLNLKPNDLTHEGSVLSYFFRPNNLLDTGLPLVDSFPADTSEIHELFPEGYWSLEANNDFEVADYNIDMDGAGFDNVQPITRVLKQDAIVKVWEVDGTHADADGTVAKRENLDDGIPDNGNRYAFGRARPYIKEQPVNDTVCELGTDGNFKVRASGRLWPFSRLKYQWQISKDDGATWDTLVASHPDFDNYQGTDEKELLINVAYLSMDQYQYRVIVTDKHGNDKISDPATLVVERLPTAILTPADDLLCNDETTEIEVTSDLSLPGTTYILEVLNNSTTSITGAFDDSFAGDTVIRQTLTNPGSNIDSVIYRIVPYGPSVRFCEGWADTVTIRVNPTPDIELVVPDSVICNEGSTDFAVSTPNIQIGGDWYYDLTVNPDAGISGARAGGRFDDMTFTEVLTNNTSVVQKVVYHFHPVIDPDDGGVDCENGGPNDTTIVIWVNPTPDIVINVSDTVACNEDTTIVSVSTPNVTIRGDWFYDISVTEMETGISSPDASLDNRRIAEGPLGLTLINNTPHVKTVVFNFHPVIEPDDGGEDCENGIPNDTAITIFVNPSPVLLITVPQSVTDEQIYCNGADVAFSLVNNQQTVGTIKYDMEVTDENSVFSGNTPSENGRLVEDFTENPIHYQDTISGLNYRFIPYIEKLTGNPACYRPDNRQDFEIEVVPVLKSHIAPEDTVYGGFNITCNGFSDGVINLDAVGGDYRYNYSMEWRGTDASGSLLQLTEYVKEDKLENLTAGAYYYSITDTLGCFHDSLKILIEPDTLEIYFEDPQQPLCYNGTNDGAIYIDVQGGAEMYDYTYEWFNIGTEEIQSTQQDMEDVYTGEYRLTFNDINGCTFVREYRLDSPNPLSSQVSFRGGYGTYNVSCTGEKDDSLVIRGLEGTVDNDGSYQYTWYDSDLQKMNGFTDKLYGVGAGTYYYVVKDDNDCTEPDSLQRVNVREPAPIQFNLKDETYSGGWHIQCFGAENGKLTPLYSGGHFNSQPHVYSWTGAGIAAGDSIQSDLGPGVYTLQVEDINGWCSADTIFELYEHPEITYDSVLSSYIGGLNISCFDAYDGSIDLVNVQGGGTTSEAGEYAFKWETLQGPAGFEIDTDTLPSIDNVPAGKYAFTITDQIGCFINDSIVITQPDSLHAIPGRSLRNGYEISCFNGSDGWVSLEPSGGIRPYTYEWSETGGSTDTIIAGLSAGQYAVTITDPNGCENGYAWQLQHPDTLVLNPDPSRLIECYGDTSTIQLSPEGGVEGYTYLWEGGITTRDLNGALEGTYHVAVTDANNCTVEDSIYLGQRSRIMPEIIVKSDYNGQHISCYESADAIVELVVSGGNDQSYNFAWNTGSEDNNQYLLSRLSAGLYSVNGEDASGCAFDTSKQVIEPSDIDVTYTSKEPLCYGNENGRISISVVGGTPMTASPIYNYSLNGTENLPEPVFDSLPEGEYLIMVKDANDCVDTTLVELIAPDPLKMEYETTPAECKDKPDGTLTINYIEGGTLPYFINDGTSQYFDNLLPGEFIIDLVDGNGCRLTDTVQIERLRLLCIDPPNAFTPNGDGANDLWMLADDDNGVNDMYLYPNAVLRIYNRWGAQVYYSDNVANEPWDGTFRGRELPIDSYHYVLDLGNGDPPITGNVTIIRGETNIE